MNFSKHFFVIVFFIFYFLPIEAQTLFYENFEIATTSFDATPFYKNSNVYCNAHIRTNTNIDCYGTAFVNALTSDVTTGNSNFLFHGTYYPSGSETTIGEVWGTVNPITVTRNTNYTFSFYLGNVFSNNAAQLEPFINGNRIAVAVSATGAGNTSWKKFSFCWNSANATSADLSLSNLTNIAIGNDFVLDEIKFEVATNTAFNQTLILCNGQSLKVGNNTYNSSGNYTDILKASNGCDSLISTRLTIIPPLSKNQSFTICAHENIKVGLHIYTKAGNYTDTIKNRTGCDSLIMTVISNTPYILQSQTINLKANQSVKVGNKTYTCSGTFIDTVKAINGCDSIITSKIISSTGEGGHFAIPNAFSPNGDNINDVFYILNNNCLKSIKRFAIYDRWGEMVFFKSNFQTNDPAYGWDGTFKTKAVPSDVFVYWFEAENQDGSLEIFKGDVTLIR